MVFVKNTSFVALPDVSESMFDWFQQMTFEQVTKQTINFQDVETKTDVNFLGVWQPFSSQKLLLKPEGQRMWRWFTCHAQPFLTLNPDEIIIYLGVKYRVMEKLDYTRYGYVEYHLVDDYTASGPT